MAKKPETLAIRPYELMEIVARMGAGRKPEDLGDKRLTDIMMAIKKDPRIPVKLRLYEGKKCDGRAKDAPDGVLFHMLWDWEIMHKMLERSEIRNYWPLSGHLVLLKLASKVPTSEGLCTFETPTGKAWQGSSTIQREDYERGVPKLWDFVRDLLPSFSAFKTPEERAQIKASFVRKIYAADTLRVFPSHLFWVICVFGGQMRKGHISPLTADNLVEVGESMRRKPDIPVMLVPEYCMVCPGCGGYDLEGSGSCRVQPMDRTTVEKTDPRSLQILRTLGLEYFERVPAAKLVRLTMDRMPLDHPALTYKGAPPNPDMVRRGLEAGMGFVEAHEDPGRVIRRVRRLLSTPGLLSLLPADDRRYVRGVLDDARSALQQGDRKKAYGRLIEERFWICWKTYLESAPRVLAQLPGRIRKDPVPADGSHALTARHTRQAMRCDGNLDEAAWRKCGFCSGFSTVGERPALAEVGFKVVYDEQTLYIGVLCAEKDTRKLKADARLGTEIVPKDQHGKNLQYHRADDGLTVVIQPRKAVPVFFHFTVNSKGVKLGQRIPKKRPRKGDAITFVRETEWEAAAQVAGRKLWSVELSVPFKTLEIGRPGTRPWGINVQRFFRNDLAFRQVWSWDEEDAYVLGRPGCLTFEA